MSVAANDIIRVTAVMQGPSGRLENVYHFRINTLAPGSDTAIMLDFASKLEDVYGHLVSLMDNDITFVQVEGFNVTQSYPMPTVSWPTLTAGSGSGGNVAAGVAGLALLRTGIKRVLGRKFFPGIHYSGYTVTTGLFNSTVVTALAAAAGELIGTFIGSNTLSILLPGVRDKTGAFWAFVEGIATSNPAYQRRRRKDRGV